MTAQQEVEALERYFEWREERTVQGVDVTTAAYREHLRNIEARETLEEIARHASQIAGWAADGTADASDLERFHRTVLDMIPDQYKEVAA